MESLNDDLFKKFEDDEITNLAEIKGGLEAASTGNNAWMIEGKIVFCESDSMIGMTVIAGYYCD